MKSFKDPKETHMKVIGLQDEIKEKLQTYISRNEIGINNYQEKLFDQFDELGLIIFDELTQQSENMNHLIDKMENLDGDAQIITAFTKAYITDQIIIEIVNFEELEETICFQN